ncbi:MAG: hypothetical protein ACTS3F_14545 [Phycisphaerales bacterium]
MLRTPIALTIAAGCAATPLAMAGTEIEWKDPVSGLWNNSTLWDPANVPNMAGESANISVPGIYVVTIDSPIGIDNLAIVNPSAQLDISSGDALTILSGQIKNSGRIVVNYQAATFNATLALSPTTQVSGEGEIILQRVSGDAGDARLTAQPGTYHAPDHTIRGSGLIEGTLENEGAIIADDFKQPLDITAQILNDNGIIIGLDFGAVRLVSGGSIFGGTLDTLSGGVIIAEDGLIDSVDIVSTGIVAVEGGGLLEVSAGTIDNEGVIVVNRTGNSFNAQLLILDSVTFAGDGEVQLNQINTDPNDARVVVQSGATLTNTADHEFIGAGRIEGDGSLQNDGIISAEFLERPLRINLPVVQSPAGLVRAVDDLVLIENLGSITGGILGGIEPAFVSGAGGAIDAVTNVGNLAIEGGATLDLGPGGLTNDGKALINRQGNTFNARLIIEADTTIDGDGTMTLNRGSSDPFDAEILISDGAQLTHTGSHTIRGAGRISGDVLNDAIILANDTAQPLTILGDITQTTSGSLRATDGSFLYLQPGTTVQGGSVITSGDGAVSAIGGLSTASSLTNEGTLATESSGAFDLLAGPFVNNADILINRLGNFTNCRVLAAEDVTISGTGNILLNAQTSDQGDAELGAHPGAMLTVGVAQSITGSGRISGQVEAQGTLTPVGGPASIIQVTGNLSLAPTTLVEAILQENPSRSPVTSRFTGAGAIDLDGTLGFNAVGLDPLPLTVFDLVDGPGVTGVFTTFDDSNLPDPFEIRVDYPSPTTLTVIITCRGDLNADSNIDSDDLGVLLGQFGSAVPPRSGGDIDGDGFVNSDDLGALLGAFGQNCADLVP